MGAVGAVEHLLLRTDDGVDLQAAWHRVARPQAAAVVVHGFSASAEDPGIVALVSALYEARFDVLAYDARGHGRSGGRCEVGSAEHRDVASAVKAAVAFGVPIVVIGISMGGVAVARYLADTSTKSAPVVGAVLVSTPARWRMSPSPAGLLAALLTRTRPGRGLAARALKVRVAPRWRTGEPPEALVGRVEIPVAVVHGAADHLLSPAHARRLHRAHRGPGRLEVVAAMGHGVRHQGVSEVVEAAEWVASHEGAVLAAPAGHGAP